MADAALLFMVPQAAGTRHPALDQGSIDFLRNHLGLQRFATLGPFQPNFGGVFGVASANSNYLPSPSLWSDFVRTRLRPGGDPALFTGFYPPDTPGQPTNADILQQHLPDYAAIGVRYVLAAPGPDPFAPAPAWTGPVAPIRLAPGGELSGRLLGGARPIVGLTVVIGTYSGVSDCVLEAELCGTDGCARGEASLAGAADNEPLLIRVDRPVAGTTGWSWALHHRGSQPVAVWQSGEAGDERFKVAPVLAPAAHEPALAYAGASMTIYELADVAPYWSVEGGPCVLQPDGRHRVAADCAAPAMLVRRELAMPGWRAVVDGQARNVEQTGPLFQAVRLARGRSRAAFSYAPPGLPAFTGLFLAGCAGLLPWHRARRRSRPSL